MRTALVYSFVLPILAVLLTTEGLTLTMKSSSGLDRTRQQGAFPSPVFTDRRQLFISAVVLGTHFVTPVPARARNLPQSTGADISNTGSLLTLIPVVQLRNKVNLIYSDIIAASKIQSFRLPELPKGLPRDENSFKRILDGYSDPVSYKQKFVDQNAFLVYYTKGFDGPGRPSMEDGLPMKQTLQYGSRNDAWVAWEEFLSEYAFAQQQQEQEVEGKWDQDDLLNPLRRVLMALDTYLSLAPQEDIQEAQQRARDK